VSSLVGAIAREGGATVRLLRVYPVPEHVVGPRGTISYVDQEMDRLTGEGVDEMRPLEEQLDDVAVETVVRFGEPVPEILLEAEAFDADLIAVTANRRGHVARALAPGVSDRLLASSDVPVLLLRE
jgi:nucleotide-binding universal stress UspA family protein